MLKVAEELETVLCAEIPGDLRTCRPSPNKHGVLLVCGEARERERKRETDDVMEYHSAALSSDLLVSTI